MKITTYIAPTVADPTSSVEGLSPDDFTPNPDFNPEGSSHYYGADGDDYSEARGRGRRRFKKALKKIGRYHPASIVSRGVKNLANADGFNNDEFYNTEGETYSYIDKANKTEVKAFQDYVIRVKKDTAILGSAGVDGLWGDNTQKAYDKYGADWEEYKKKAMGVMGAFLGIPSSSPVPSTAPAVSGEPTPAQVEEQKKKGLFWDKAKKTWVSAKEIGLVDYVLDIFGAKPKEAEPTPKKLSNTSKTILYVGGAVILGLIIYAIAKPKKRA
jgi:hypothetical protein